MDLQGLIYGVGAALLLTLGGSIGAEERSPSATPDSARGAHPHPHAWLEELKDYSTRDHTAAIEGKTTTIRVCRKDHSKIPWTWRFELSDGCIYIVRLVQCNRA